MRDFVVWGAGGHARVLSDLLALTESRIIALFDNDPAVASPLPVPLFHGAEGFQRWFATRAPTACCAAVAMGGSRGSDRRRYLALFKDHGLLIPALVHPAASVAASAHVGAGSQVLALAAVTAAASVGSGVIINTRASVDHECRLDDGVHIGPGATLCGLVQVGEDSFIGAGATVLPRIRIGARVVVGAGALVTRDLPDGVVAMGSPARITGENQDANQDA